jgi:rubrerythrin
MNAIELKDPETRLQSVRELWCERCGYGVVVRREPPRCPMCRETSWRRRPRSTRYN